MKPIAPALGLSFCLVAAVASAHTIIKDPAPIGSMNDIKTGPCGCVFVAGDDAECPATFPVRQLNAGDQLDVTWTEFINHPGKFRIALTTVAPEDATMDDLDAGVLWEGPDNNTTVPKDLSQTILVPATPCTKCTLQVRQYMSDSDNYYFSCAAVQILDGTGGTGPTTTSTTGAGGAPAEATSSATAAASTGGLADGEPHYVPEPGDPTKCSVSSAATDSGSLTSLALVAAGLVLHVARRRRSRV